MIEDWLDAGGEVETYTKNEDGEWEVSTNNPFDSNPHGVGGCCRKIAIYIDADGNERIEGAGGDALGDRLRNRGGILDLSYNNEYYR